MTRRRQHRMLRQAVPTVSTVTRLLTLVSALFTLTAAQEPPFAGDELCPCLMGPQDGLQPIDPQDITAEVLQQIGIENASPNATYGIGCSRHDESTVQCTTGECVESSIIPAPVGCDQSWCNRSFCWVDPLNCSLLNRRSTIFPRSGRYYSYATCYDMDSFSQKKLLGSLSGRTLKVGFNSNSGGWTGAYSRDGQHFLGPPSKWSGPAVNFVVEGALQGGFKVELTEPREVLRNRSLDFFSSSTFDYCVYATALGYLDMCVADYSVTEERASSTDWLLLGTEALYLVAQTDVGGQSKWSETVNNVATIFQPFTTGAWMFIILAVIPVLGLLMLVHEYNHRGTIFQQTQAVVPHHLQQKEELPGNLTSRAPTRQDLQQQTQQRIPFYQHVVKSIFITLLSTLHQTYEAPVVTYGAKIHLLGISFFILTIIAVYTANLAAILTQQSLVTTVDSLTDALSLGYRICGERKNIEDLKNIYGIDDSVFAVDPVEEGGDGGAGFNCARCKSRTRVFDFLDVNKAQDDPSYCHVAIAPIQDLDVFQSAGVHCNKTIVGQPIRFVQSGLPVTESISREVIAFFLKLKNDGVYDKELISSRPDTRCSAPEGGEGSALSVEQLMGIWVVTFGFAFLGVLVTCLRPLWIKRHRPPKFQPVYRQDQWGMRMSRELEEEVELMRSFSSRWDTQSVDQLPPLDEKDASSAPYSQTTCIAESTQTCQYSDGDNSPLDSNSAEEIREDFAFSATRRSFHGENAA